MKKGFLTLALAGILSAGLLVGCGSKSTATAKGPINIDFWYSIGGKNGEELKSLVDKFNSSQSEVKVNAVQQGDYYENATKLQSAIVANNQPDMTMLEASQVGQFGKSKALADLSSYFNKDEVGKFQEGLLKNSYIDNKFVAMPFNRSTPVLYLNKNILKQAGLDENGPKNWEELKSYAKTIKEKVPGVVGFETPIDIWFIEAGVFEQGGEMFTSDEKDVAFQDGGKKLLKLWQDMVKEGSMKAPAGQDYNAWDAANNDFLSGKVAMIQTSTGSLSGILQNSQGKFEVGTSFLPAGAKYAVPTGGANLSVLAKSSDKEKEASVKFMKFLSQKENVAEFSKISGYIPTTKEALEDDEIKKLYEKSPQYKTAIEQLKTAGTSPMVKGFREISVKIQEEFKKPLVDTTLSTDEAVEKAAKDVKDILASNK